MQITVIERAQQIQIQEQEIIRRERELEATIRKPAEAEKYRLEKIADANRSVIQSCAVSSSCSAILFNSRCFRCLLKSRFRPNLSHRGCTHISCRIVRLTNG